MIEIRQTEVFSAWFEGLRDRRAAKRIVARIRRLSEGNPGQHRMLSRGIGEMKIDYGPGYRLYYTQRGPTLVILLCGGDKRGQTADIATARKLAKQL